MNEQSLGIPYSECEMSLDQLVAPDPSATFIGQASGDSMNGVGIFDGDLLVIDRSVKPKHQDVIVANINGEFVCKIVDMKNRALVSASDLYPPVYVSALDEFSLEGVVTSSIRVFRQKGCIKSKLY